MSDEGENFTKEYIKSVIESRFGFRPRNAQVECIRTVLVNQKDLILYAKTSFGKGLIYQAAPLMYSPPKTALIIMPLRALEQSQHDKLLDIEEARPFVLDGQSNTLQNLRQIRNNKYTHGKESSIEIE